MRASKPDLWERKVFFVGKHKPTPSVLGVQDIELDRTSFVSRPMTHVIGFYDKHLANLAKRMASEDFRTGMKQRWVLDDDAVDEFLCSRMRKSLDADDVEPGREDAGKPEPDFEFDVQYMRFDELQRWTGSSGMVLRVVETVDRHLVVTSHYPREDARFYVPYLDVCWSLE